MDIPGKDDDVDDGDDDNVTPGVGWTSLVKILGLCSGLLGSNIRNLSLYSVSAASSSAHFVTNANAKLFTHF